MVSPAGTRVFGLPRTAARAPSAWHLLGSVDDVPAEQRGIERGELPGIATPITVHSTAYVWCSPHHVQVQVQDHGLGATNAHVNPPVRSPPRWIVSGISDKNIRR